MAPIEIEYLGSLHCRAVHIESGAALTTDAPKDNRGEGKSFSPTDLVGTAMGTCMLTIMGIEARKMNVDIAGAKAIVQKEMSAVPMRRISVLTVDIHVPGRLSPEHRRQLEEAAYSCPVHQSLHPDVRQMITFHWG